MAFLVFYNLSLYSIEFDKFSTDSLLPRHQFCLDIVLYSYLISFNERPHLYDFFSFLEFFVFLFLFYLFYFFFWLESR